MRNRRLVVNVNVAGFGSGSTPRVASPEAITPANISDVAAEAIRDLNHATRD